MATIAYLRVSSVDQSLDRQDIQADKIFEEKLSGKNRNRPALAAMIDYVREGDIVKVWDISRLARDLIDLQNIITEINNKGASIQFITENLTFSPDVDNPMATMQLQMMGAFAQFERAVKRQRQLEGIAIKKAKGGYKGGKKQIDRNKVIGLRSEGHSTYKIANLMNISRMSVHRILKENAA
jgi:DNA invertase Pin-like site-specific DNA recombinase